jgi:DNA-binding Lrp family transcriptional regulator
MTVGAPGDLAPGLTLVDARLIDFLHDGFPLCDHPFAHVGAALGLSEDDVIERLRQLLAGGVLTRLGPLYQIERGGGAYLLAALAVPPARFAEVAAQVNAHLQVAHNYRREHRLNMWFVLAADTPQAVTGCLRAIEAETGLRVHAFPKEREYRVELRLPALPRAAESAAATIQNPPSGPLGRFGARREASPDAPGALNALNALNALSALDPLDRQLIAATQSGLPLVPQPYEAIGALVGLSEREVQERLGAMLQRGLIRRIGAVANHYRLGYTANGMTVWDVDDARVDALGERVGQLPGVTHCYRRPRDLPLWPYNLFVMLHGRSRAAVERQAQDVAALLGGACRAHDILYSTEVLKKTGLRLALP